MTAPRASLLLATAILLSPRATASAFGVPDSDSATLAALLLAAIKDSAQLGQILATGQQALETAQYTLGAARAATDVVTEFAYLTQNPDEIFDASASAFNEVFPEIKAISDDASAIRESFSGHAQGRLNPYALQEFFANAAGASQSAYQTLVAMDESAYGLTKEHLVTMELMQNVQTTSEAIRRESMLAMTPQGAAALSAKASAQTAVSAAVSATNLAELVRMQKAEYMKGLDSASKGAAELATQFEAFKATLAAPDPVLDPTNPNVTGGSPPPGR